MQLELNEWFSKNVFDKKKHIKYHDKVNSNAIWCLFLSITKMLYKVHMLINSTSSNWHSDRQKYSLKDDCQEGE